MGKKEEKKNDDEFMETNEKIIENTTVKFMRT